MAIFSPLIILVTNIRSVASTIYIWHSELSPLLAHTAEQTYHIVLPHPDPKFKTQQLIYRTYTPSISVSAQQTCTNSLIFKVNLIPWICLVLTWVFDFNFMFWPNSRLLPCCPVSQRIWGSPPPRWSSSGAGTSPGVENEKTWWQPWWSVRSPFINWIMIRMIEIIVGRSSWPNRLHVIQNLKQRKPHVTPTMEPPTTTATTMKPWLWW